MTIKLKTNLARLLDTFPDTEVGNDPRKDQAANHAPVQAAHVVNAIGDAQHFVFPKLLGWRRPLGNGRSPVRIVLIVPNAATVAFFTIRHTTV